MRLPRVILYGLCTALAFSLMNVCIKLLPAIPSQEIVLFRSIITGIFVYIAIRAQRVHPLGQPSNRWRLFLRGLAGYMALSAYFFCLKNLDIGSATVIQYMSPVFSGIFAYLILREPISPGQWICLLSGLIGIGFITHVLPDVDLSHLRHIPSVIACFLSAILSGVAYALVRGLSKSGENSNVIILSFSLVSIPFALLFSVGEWVMPASFLEWVWLLGVGVTSHCGQVFLTRALSTDNTVTATNMLYCTPILATVWSMLFFNGVLTWQFICGSILILGVQFIFLRKKNA